jgi:choline-sulfatase
MKLKKILLATLSLAAVLFPVYLFLHKHPPRPNVVLVVIDTLRADHLPFHGYPKETAPFLSKLAARGVLFEKAYAASSWTAPATASIFTSLYPFQHGVVMGFMAQMQMIKSDPRIRLNRIPDKVTTLPEVFRRSGYRTFGVADNVNICRDQGFEQGFDRLMTLRHQGGRVLNRRVLELESDIRAGGPYFLYVHYNDPHIPYRIPLKKAEETGDPLKDKKAMYDKEIAFVDSCLEELYTRFGWSRNTLLVVTADHGEEMMEREVYGHGKSLYNTVIHVPLLFSWPEREIVVPARRAANVSTMDIMPTLISLLGFPRVKGLVGKGLAPELEGKAGADGARRIYSHLHTWAGTPDQNLWMACLDGDFKYIFKAPDTHSLYDLKRDPGEDRNLYAQEQRTALRLAKSLFDFERSCPRYNAEYVDFKLDDPSIEHLRSLGYIH